eukprot:TRINITY_DN3072_c0_g2_i2.p1 TRINITY_DN3072_c0_g2~~TRINITY_DN3072_c0_g2_i2.p1  ORF type:complete len:679 (-),score=108.11 TRINITY_DN3072_c0_g2_i2:127-2109(-)
MSFHETIAVAASNDPFHQAHALTIRILLMVPIYSYTAWGVLIFRATTFAKVLTAFEKVYECITLFAFTQLMVTYLGGIEGCYTILVHKPNGELQSEGDERCNHIPPVKWLPARIVEALSWKPPSKFLHRSLFAVLLYVPLLLVCFIVTIIAWMALAEAPFLVVDQICSAIIFLYTSVAMYGLVIFYHAFMKKLQAVRPIPKLISIKVLVMVVAWQEFGVKMARRCGMLDDWVRNSESHYTSEELAETIVSGMLIVEMFIMSVAHLWIYPATETLYRSRVAEISDVDRRLTLVFNPMDIAHFYWSLQKDHARNPQLMEDIAHQMLDAGYEVPANDASPHIAPHGGFQLEAKQLKDKGASVLELKDKGYGIVPLKGAGFTLGQLNHAGFSIQELEDAGISASDLRQELGREFEAKKLKDNGLSLRDIKMKGYNVRQLRGAGFGVTDFTAAGVLLRQLNEAGFSAAEWKSARFDATRLKAFCFTVEELKEAGFSCAELKEASFTATDLRRAGFSSAELKSLFSCAELRCAGFNATDLRRAGFDASELKAGYFLPSQLKEAGFSLAELKSLFTCYELKYAGASATELRRAGFDVSELKAGYFTAHELKQAGFEASELKAVGFYASILKEAGFSNQQLQHAGFSAEEISRSSELTSFRKERQQLT